MLLAAALALAAGVDDGVPRGLGVLLADEAVDTVPAMLPAAVLFCGAKFLREKSPKSSDASEFSLKGELLVFLAWPAEAWATGLAVADFLGLAELDFLLFLLEASASEAELALRLRVALALAADFLGPWVPWVFLALALPELAAEETELALDRRLLLDFFDACNTVESILNSVIVVSAGFRLNYARANATVLRPFLQPDGPLSSREFGLLLQVQTPGCQLTIPILEAARSNH